MSRRSGASGTEMTREAWSLLRLCRRHQNVRISPWNDEDRAGSVELIERGYVTEHDGLLTITGAGKRRLSDA